jgi:hypothetical protein
MLEHDCFDWEAKEEQADKRFLLVLGGILFIVALFVCCLTLWDVSGLNPVGNLIIIR